MLYGVLDTLRRGDSAGKLSRMLSVVRINSILTTVYIRRVENRQNTASIRTSQMTPTKSNSRAFSAVQPDR